MRTTDDTNRSVITNLTIRINDNRFKDLDQDGLTQSEEGQLGTSDVQTDSDGDGVSGTVGRFRSVVCKIGSRTDKEFET